MSHVTKLKVQIKDLQALKTACEQLGLVFKENQKTYKWYGRSVGDYALPQNTKVSDLGHCDHAIAVANNKNAYEIGLVAQEDGTYSLLYDFWNKGFGLMDVVGNNCSNLVETYTKTVALSEANKFATTEGYTMSNYFDNETGETVIKLTKY